MNTPLFYQCYPSLQRLKEDATINRIENNVVVNCKEFLAMHGKKPSNGLW